MLLELEKKIINKISRIKSYTTRCIFGGYEKEKIDDMYISQYYTFDYKNIQNLIVKDKSCLFIDIGANKGYSVKMAKHFFKNCFVISYEPLKSSYKELEDLKKLYDNFEFKNVALGAETKEISINEAYNDTGLSSVFKLNSNYKYFGRDIPTVNYSVSMIEANSETEYWNSFNTDIKILKIDVQGYELEILKNLKEYLINDNIDVIYIELITIEKYIGQPSYTDIINFLDCCGFVPLHINPAYRELNTKFVSVENLECGYTTEYDVTFVKKKYLSGIYESEE
ncbi:FkbM family methyltransferase [bacterium]|nr:FkbM family methyltransferase [bacterium]